MFKTGVVADVVGVVVVVGGNNEHEAKRDGDAYMIVGKYLRVGLPA